MKKLILTIVFVTSVSAQAYESVVSALIVALPQLTTSAAIAYEESNQQYKALLIAAKNDAVVYLFNGEKSQVLDAIFAELNHQNPSLTEEQMAEMILNLNFGDN